MNDRERFQQSMDKWNKNKRREKRINVTLTVVHWSIALIAVLWVIYMCWQIGQFK